MRHSLTAAITLISITLLASNASAVLDLGSSQPLETDNYMVLFEDSVDSELVESVGGQVTGGDSIDIVPVLFVEMSESEAEALRQLEVIEAVEKDGRVRALQENTSSSSQRTPWGIEKVNSREVSRNVDASDVNVAVLDTGIDYDHEDLSDNIEWGYNARTDTEGKQAADDGYGHGTHVAGTIAAMDDGKGVVGVAPDAGIYSVKVLGDDGYGTWSDLAKGMDRAVKGPDGEIGTSDDADIISMSLGGSSGTQTLREAVESASEHTVVVASAGNDGDGDPETNEVGYPAKYSGAIAVAATDENDETSSWSSEGREVEVAAPGVNVYSTYLNDSYDYMSGTSMAAPHVSGVTALLVADSDEEFTTENARIKLGGTSVDIESSTVDRKSGYGRVRADELVESGSVAVTRIEKPQEGEAVEPGTHTVQFLAESSGDNLSVDLQVNNRSYTPAFNEETGYYEADWNTTGVSTYLISSRAEAQSGHRFIDSRQVNLENSDPRVTVDHPDEGAEVSGNVTVKLDVSDTEDSDREMSAEVWINSGEKKEARYNETSGTYDYVWNTNSYAEDEEHTVNARVEDSLGATDTDSATVTVDNEGVLGSVLGGGPLLGLAIIDNVFN